MIAVNVGPITTCCAHELGFRRRPAASLGGSQYSSRFAGVSSVSAIRQSDFVDSVAIYCPLRDLEYHSIKRFSESITAWLFLMVLPGIAGAATINVSVRDLGTALVDTRVQQDAVHRLVLDKIEQQLREAELQLSNGELLLQNQLVDQEVEAGCTRTVIQQMTTDITVASTTSISLTLESLFEPVTITLDLLAGFDAVGQARQIFGIRLGSCQSLAQDTFSFTANGPVNLRLSLTLTLDPEWLDENTLRLRPTIKIEGDLLESRIHVEVDDSLVRSLLEDFLQDEVDELLGPARIRDEIAGLQSSVDEQLQESLTGSADSDAGYIDVVLPPADDEQIIALFELLTPQARFPLTTDFIESRRVDILAALVLNDSDAIAEIVSDAAACQLTQALQIPLPRIPRYTNEQGNCRLTTDLSEQAVFVDSACKQPLQFSDNDQAGFCQVALDSNRLGNPQSQPQELGRWMYSAGSQFEIGALPIAGKTQPLVQRNRYKTVSTASGVCELEMRVYTDNPYSTKKKPLLALHGGSWQNRGTGFLGIENMATHFVDTGFVVFAPFYRLVGDSDGTAACHNATLNEVLDDTRSALQWVTANKETYGATGKPVVFGQSAGGHLAAALATQYPQQIERSVLLYAPTDFRDFSEQILSGEYSGGQGRRILEVVTGSVVEAIDLDGTLVAENSFPAIVATDPSGYPPVFMLHGESDSLLPFRQSVRLCNGYAGDPIRGPAPLTVNTETAQRIIACDTRGSQLHLIAEGEHTLDLCVSSELCLSGSPASAAKTAESLQAMLDWSAADSLPAVVSSNIGSGGGRISPGFLVLLLPLLLRPIVRRGIRQ